MLDAAGNSSIQDDRLSVQRSCLKMTSHEYLQLLVLVAAGNANAGAYIAAGYTSFKCIF